MRKLSYQLYGSFPSLSNEAKLTKVSAPHSLKQKAPTNTHTWTHTKKKWWEQSRTVWGSVGIFDEQSVNKGSELWYRERVWDNMRLLTVMRITPLILWIGSSRLKVVIQFVHVFIRVYGSPILPTHRTDRTWWRCCHLTQVFCTWWSAGASCGGPAGTEPAGWWAEHWGRPEPRSLLRSGSSL